MTMPKFDPVAHMQVSVEEGVDTYFPRLHKPEKYSADWWRFDPLYTADQLTEAYEAGKREQAAELELIRAEAERLQAESDPEALHIAYLHGQADRNQKLAAEQAKNAGLREILQTFVERVDRGEVRSVKTYTQFKKALSTPDDLSALRAHDAAIWREAAQVCEQVAWLNQNSAMLGPELNAVKCKDAMLARAEDIEKGGAK